MNGEGRKRPLPPPIESSSTSPSTSAWEAAEDEWINYINSKMTETKVLKIMDIEENQDAGYKIFSNPVILEKICKHLPVQGLLKLRRTCKLWDKTMVVELRKRHAIKGVVVHQQSIDKILEHLIPCLVNPFEKYKFRNVSFPLGKIQKLIAVVGNAMTHLELVLTVNVCLPISTFRTLMLQQSPVLQVLNISDSRTSAPEFWCSQLQPGATTAARQNLPSLKEMSIIVNPDSAERNNASASSSYTLINDLFNAAVNLQTVEFGKMPNSNQILLEALKQKTSHLSKIQWLKLAQLISHDQLQTLLELSSRKSNNKLELKQFDLTRLSVACFDGAGKWTLYKFLNFHAASLEKLVASLTPEIPPSDLQFENADQLRNTNNCQIHLPVMPKLKILHLESEFLFNNSDFNLTIEFDSLYANFPSLQKIKLMYMEWMDDKMIGGVAPQIPATEEELEGARILRQNRWVKFTTQLGPHPGITILELSLFGHDEGNYLMELASLFPNVKTLKLRLCDAFYGQLWTTWPNLELLKLHVNFEPKEFEIDSAITGIPSESLKLLRKTYKAGISGLLQTQDWKEEYKTCPGMLNLTELRELKLELHEYHSKSTYITDFSGYFGFVDHPSLRRISINRCSNFSRDCISTVEASLGIYGQFTPTDIKLKSNEFPCCRMTSPLAYLESGSGSS